MNPPHTWQIGGGLEIDLSVPRVMAILNVTPDSFSDGGTLTSVEAAVERGINAVADGAAVLDIGGESTRPGAERVSASQQIDRVGPVIEALAEALPETPLSVDTTLARVAESAVRLGASIVNDVSAGLDDADMLSTVARLGVGYIAMHRVKPPEHDQYSDRYASAPLGGDAFDAVRNGLAERLRAATGAGVDQSRIVLDPGLGFGKTVEQNLELIRRTDELLALGSPILSGASRKSFVGRAGLGRDSDPSERLGASIAASLLHAQAGARLFRVHDVAEQARALRLWQAVSEPHKTG